MIKKKIKELLYKNKSNIHKDLKLNLMSNENRDLNYTIKCFGNLNNNKIFYVIQRFRGGGMFSNINYILHHLYLCENFGCIPVIDFENYPTKYIPATPGEMRETMCKNTDAREILDWEPKIDVLNWITGEYQCLEY